MLMKLVINNFKSFKNETIIDFTKTNYKVLDDVNVSEGVLKGTMFIGANASGKSNALFAVRLLLDELFKEVDNDPRFLHCLFSEKNQFSVSYFFVIDNIEINYYLEMDVVVGMVIEKLYLDKELLLERMGNSAKSYITDKENFYDLNNEILFLRTIYFNTGFAGKDKLRKWFEFLQNSVYINAFDRSIISYGKHELKLIKYIQENTTSEINEFFKEHNFEQTIDYTNESKGENIAIKISKEDEKILFFKRKGIEVPIPFNYESLGNRTLLNMLPPLLFVVKNNGMLLVDEFSSGFHNELEELLVKYFMRASNKSQMIFVSHSTNLLTTAILRPDQVYSVDFKECNGTSLKRFSEEQPRVAQNLEKMYLSGVFGGLPNYKDAYED